MMDLMMKWVPTCREVSGLVAHDVLDTVPWPKRFLIRMHLSMCTLCSRFARQLQLVEKVFRDRWTTKHDPARLAFFRQRLVKRLSRELR